MESRRGERKSEYRWKQEKLRSCEGGSVWLQGAAWAVEDQGLSSGEWEEWWWSSAVQTRITPQKIPSTLHGTSATDTEFHTCGTHYPDTEDESKVFETDL